MRESWYRSKADECARLAKASVTENIRHEYQKLEKQWRQIAEHPPTRRNHRRGPTLAISGRSHTGSLNESAALHHRDEGADRQAQGNGSPFIPNR
jgi:hypothetical protein